MPEQWQLFIYFWVHRRSHREIWWLLQWHDVLDEIGVSSVLHFSEMICREERAYQILYTPHSLEMQFSIELVCEL